MQLKITVMIIIQHGTMYMIISLSPKSKFTKKKQLCACFFYNYEKNTHTKVDYKEIHKIIAMIILKWSEFENIFSFFKLFYNRFILLYK